jgi:hypothetical protein
MPNVVLEIPCIRIMGGEPVMPAQLKCFFSIDTLRHLSLSCLEMQDLSKGGCELDKRGSVMEIGRLSLLCHITLVSIGHNPG